MSDLTPLNSVTGGQRRKATGSPEDSPVLNITGLNGPAQKPLRKKKKTKQGASVVSQNSVNLDKVLSSDEDYEEDEDEISDMIKSHLAAAFSSESFLNQVTSVVTSAVVVSMNSITPKITDCEEKISNLISAVEILQEELNRIKSNPGKIDSDILTGIKEDFDSLKKQCAEKDNYILDLNKRIEHLESYSRRNSVRISGIPLTETRGNDVQWMIDFSAKHLGVKLTVHDIGRMHRTGKNTVDRPSDILVKFSTYLNRHKVFEKRSFLYSKLNKAPRAGVFINENLTRQRSSLFYIARRGVKDRKIASAWTHDGAIITKQFFEKEAPIKKWLHHADMVPYLAHLPVLPPRPTPIATDDTTADGTVGIAATGPVTT